jgi:hypothetical protein
VDAVNFEGGLPALVGAQALGTVVVMVPKSEAMFPIERLISHLGCLTSASTHVSIECSAQVHPFRTQ